MADIAFLLLIFFLVTTTMSVEMGILRILPPYDPIAEPAIVPERNVLRVLVNDSGELIVEDELMVLDDLRGVVQEFMTNPSDRPDLPQMRVVSMGSIKMVGNFELDRELQDRLRTIELIGPYRELPPNAVISLQTGSQTSYDMYVQVQNELESAIRELRDQLSKKKFGRSYSELDEKSEEDRDLIKAIRMVYPQRVSEAEPVEIDVKQ